MPLYPVRALERAMKISEVITRAISGKINWIQAAEILGMSDRQLRRWRGNWAKYGYNGLFDRRTQRPSPKRVPLADVEKVLRLYREKYFDLNVKHFVEKLHAEEHISLSYRWIPGLDQYQDLIVIFDDATSEVYDVQLVDEESTVTVMAALKRVVETRGLFCSLYSDRGSHMAWTPKAGGPVDRQKPTQIARALDQLGIELILAYSPQARGRCERIFGTWQGRLPQEFRLRGITEVEAANEFLRKDWIPMHDASFSLEAEQTGTAFLPYTGTELEKIFSYENRCLQIPQQTFRFSLARCPVLVCEHLDGTISLHYGPHRLGHYDSQGQLLPIPHLKTGQAAAHRALRSSPINDPGAKSFRAAGLRVTQERKKDQKRKKGAA